MKKIIFLFLITGISIISCSKNKDLPLDGAKLELSNSVQLRSSEEGVASPECNDGVLWFFDYHHIDAYYDYLDSIEETWVEDGFLQQNDAQFDFVSLRSTFDDAESLEDPFNKDDIYMSMLNEYSEIGIGEYLYFERIGERYRVDRKDEATIVAIRNIPKEELLSNELLFHHNIEVVFSNTQRTIIKGPGWPASWPPVTNREDCIASAIISTNNSCSEEKRTATVAISHEGVSTDYTSNEYGVIISWGDGVTEDIPDENFGDKTFSHPYSSDGIFIVTVQIWGHGVCSGKKLLDNSKPVSFSSCRRIETDATESCTDGDWKLEVKLFNKIWDTQDNHHREKIKAKACTFKNGRKRRKRKELGEDAEWRTGICTHYETDSHYKNKKKKCIRVKLQCKSGGTWTGHNNSDVTAWARLYQNDACRVDLNLNYCD